MFVIFSYAAGLLFGLGLVVSQMINPAKVLGFLDLFGHWDPSLALVMASALAVSALGYAAMRRRGGPLAAPRFEVSTRRELSARLLVGATLFGIGWGLVGLCPGPALTVLPLGHWQAFVFVAAMLAGMLAFEFIPAEAPRSALEGRSSAR